jgi:nucleotide-binding universal stress UspA family protein
MKILIPYDGSRYAKAAVAFVAARAAPTGKQPSVLLLNVQAPAATSFLTAQGRTRLANLYKDRAHRILQPALKALRKAGLDAKSRYVIGSPGIRIARVAAATGADLIVMGTHGRSALAGMLMGSVAQTVVAFGTTPVLLVRDAAPPPRPGPLRVGIAVDGSRYGEAAVRYVLRQRALFGADARITLLHAVPELPLQLKTLLENLASTSFTHEKVRALRQQACDAAMRSGLRLLGAAGVDYATECLSGNPGDALAEYARRHLDLLVMGSRGQGAFKAAVLGSVAMRTAARCTTPLLLIRRP